MHKNNVSYNQNAISHHYFVLEIFFFLIISDLGKMAKEQVYLCQGSCYLFIFVCVILHQSRKKC